MNRRKLASVAPVAGIAIWGWVALSTGIAGCAVEGTQRFQEHKRVLAEKEAAAEVTKQENKKDISDLKRQELELDFKAQEFRLRSARQSEIDRAAIALGGDASEALSIANAVFQQEAEARAKREEWAANKVKRDELIAQAKAMAAEAAANAPDGESEVTAAVDPNAEPALPPEAAELITGPRDTEEVVIPDLSSGERVRLLVIKATALYVLAEESRPEEAEAITVFKEAIAVDPSYRPARLNLGKLLFKHQRHEEALEIFQLELEDGYRSGEILFLMAQCHSNLAKKKNDPTRLESARLAVQQALIEKPNDSEIERWLAVLSFQTQRYDDAARVLSGILAKNPLDSEYREYYANTLIKLGRLKDAVHEYETMCRLGETSTAIKQSLSDLYAELRFPARAAHWLEKAYEGQAPSEVDIVERRRLGELHMLAGDYNSAVRWFDTISKAENPKEYLDTLKLRADLRREQGREDEALTLYNEARHLDPADGQLHVLVGEMYLDRQDYKRASSAFAKATTKDTLPDGKAGLAECAYEQDDLKRAVDLYEDAVKARPDDRRLIISLQQIRQEYEQRQLLEQQRSEGR